MTEVFTKNGELITLELRTLKKIMDYLDGLNGQYKLISRLETNFSTSGNFLILAVSKDSDGNSVEKNIGYIKDEEGKLQQLIGEDKEPEIGEVKIVSSKEETGGIVFSQISIEVKNSLKFIERENRDITVELTTSTVLYKGTASIMKEITDEINQFGKVNVVGSTKEDKLVASYKDKEFATIIANEDVVESLVDLANMNQLVISLNKREANKFLGTVIKPKDLAVLNISEEIETVSKEIVARGILTEEELAERVEYFNSCEDVRKNQILMALEFINKVKDEEIANMIIPERPETLFIDYNNIMSDILDGVFVGDNICLAGPKSVGKNVAIETTSWALLLPIGELTLNPQTTNENLYGAPNVKNDNGVPVTEFDMSALVAAFSGEKTRFIAGGISLADEINAAPSATMMPMQAAYDWRQHIEIPNYKKVHKHPRSISFSTMNPGYLAMKPLNEAIADRFNTTIFMENGIDFYKVLERQHGEDLNVELAKQLSMLYKKFFDMVNEADLDMDSDIEIDDKVLTIRGFKSAYEKIQNGQDFIRAITNSVLNKVSDKETRSGLYEVVTDTFSK